MWTSFKVLSAIIVLSVSSLGCATEALSRYQAQPRAVTVSGVSSGAAMAMQMHIAYSRVVKGAGLFAGVPFGCAGVPGSFVTCMQKPEDVPVSLLVQQSKQLSLVNSIDPIDNLHGSRVYLWQGAKDSVVKAASADNIRKYYQAVGKGKVEMLQRIDLKAQHGMPVTWSGAKPCGELGAPWMVNCGYDAIGEMFQHFYKAPQSAAVSGGQLHEFNQKKYDPSGLNLGPKGYLYVPNRCHAKGSCSLHIAFHGCHQEAGRIGHQFATKTDYIKWAEYYGLIILFPSSVTTKTNPNGCWNWFGGAPDVYPNNITKTGIQMSLVWKMATQIMRTQ